MNPVIEIAAMWGAPRLQCMLHERLPLVTCLYQWVVECTLDNFCLSENLIDVTDKQSLRGQEKIPTFVLLPPSVFCYMLRLLFHYSIASRIPPGQTVDHFVMTKPAGRGRAGRKAQ